MILTLDEAKKLNPEVTQNDLDAFEVAVRKLTNNNFQNQSVRFTGLNFEEPDLITLNTKPFGLRIGDTIQINETGYNDGLFVIKVIDGTQITVEDGEFFGQKEKYALLTKVEYPADIKAGIEKLISYDKVLAKKRGIKSETISRMSVTYYDVNSTEVVDGYPASLMTFLDKYNKMRW